MREAGDDCVSEGDDDNDDDGDDDDDDNDALKPVFRMLLTSLICFSYQEKLKRPGESEILLSQLILLLISLSSSS